MPSFPNGQPRSANNERHERNCRAGDVLRARLILAVADGLSYMQINKTLRTTAPTIARWKQRFEQHGIEGLEAQQKAAGRLLRLRPYKPRCAARCSRSLGTEARIGRYPNCQQQSYRWGHFTRDHFQCLSNFDRLPRKPAALVSFGIQGAIVAHEPEL
jgi:hypothetical protein